MRATAGIAAPHAQSSTARAGRAPDPFASLGLLARALNDRERAGEPDWWPAAVLPSDESAPVRAEAHGPGRRVFLAADGAAVSRERARATAP